VGEEASSELDKIRGKVNSRDNSLITEEVEADEAGGLAGETTISRNETVIPQSTSARIGS
jgi:hypothetical protein